MRDAPMFQCDEDLIHSFHQDFVSDGASPEVIGGVDGAFAVAAFVILDSAGSVFTFAGPGGSVGFAFTAVAASGPGGWMEGAVGGTGAGALAGADGGAAAALAFASASAFAFASALRLSSSSRASTSAASVG